METGNGDLIDGRSLRAERSRRDIVEAAELLFLRDGYTHTSIGAIAEEAQVAIQTVYNAVGQKADVLSAVLDRAAAGPSSPRSVRDFMSERTAPVATAEEFVEMLAEWFAEVQPRLGPIVALISGAAASDDAVADLEKRRASQRLSNYGLAAEELLKRPGVRTLTRGAIAALIWSIGHPQTYRHLVEVEGWSLDEYRAWVRTSLAAALVTTD